ALLAAALRLSAEERTTLATAARSALRRAPPPTGAPVVAAPADEELVPLVGRQRELSLLAQFLAGVDEWGRATPPLLLLAGEPGIGKTRLLEATVQQAVAQGRQVLFSGCHRRGGQEPYSPLLDALAQHLQRLPPSARSAALAACAWLGRLLPEVADALEPLTAGAVALEQERRLLFAAVR